MADQPTTPSGSRWEPEPDDAAVDGDGTPQDLETDGDTATAIPPPPDDEQRVVPPTTAASVDEDRRERLRGRAVLAGAATALTLGSGLAGFVIGHSTAGDDTNGFRPANFSGQQPGGQLGDGTQQGPPGFGDRDRDDDGGGDNGRGQPPQGDNGSSDGTSSSSSGTAGTGT